jgi:UDP-glucose 4-epimerase
MENLLSSSVVTITGGTGSFGKAMAKKLLQDGVSEIRIFSRDESKQDEMRNSLSDNRLKFIIGDVRDYSSIDDSIRGSDYVFHAAALKQVPSCEFFPMQAVATNVSGSSNVIKSALKHEVKGLVCLSSDKAVYPINAMGMTKALMEKIAYSFARNFPNSKTRISVTRYGNVMMSRGSVIPLFLKQIIENKPITITNPNMTRFMMSLEDSISLVKYAFTNASTGDLFVKKAPACTVETLVMALANLMGVQDSIEINTIGIRHGEKIYESLLGTEESLRCIDNGDYFRIPLDARSLDYQIYYEKGQPEIIQSEAYTSHNTKQLNMAEVINILKNLPEFVDFKELNSK